MDEESRARARIAQDNHYRILAHEIVSMVPARSTDAVDKVQAFLIAQYGYPDVRDEQSLTLHDAGCLAAVLSVVDRRAKVGRMIGGRIYLGEARSIGTQDARFATDPRIDVRDLYVRVTLDTGVEAFWLVSELMAEYPTGHFVPDYEIPAVL